MKIAPSLPWILAGILPFLVVPSFLNATQEPKTMALEGVLALILLGRLRNKTPADLCLRGLGLWLSLLLLCCTLSTLFAAQSPWISLYGARTLLLPVFAALVIGPMLTLERWFLGLAWGGTLLAITGILQVLWDVHMLSPANDPGQFPAVTMGNRGLAAFFVGFAIIATLHLRTKSTRQLLYTAALLVQSVFVLAAATRSVFLGLSLAALLLAVQSTLRLRRATLLRAAAGGCTIVILGLLLMLASQSLQVHVQHLVSPENWLNNPRWDLWSESLRHMLFEVSQTQRLFGHGPGSFEMIAFSWLEQTPLAGRYFREAHNDGLQIFVEYGFLGIVAVLGLIWALVRRCCASTPDTRPFVLALVLYFAGVGMFFYPLQIPFAAFLLWLPLVTAGASMASPDGDSRRSLCSLGMTRACRQLEICPSILSSQALVPCPKTAKLLELTTRPRVGTLLLVSILFYDVVQRTRLEVHMRAVVAPKQTLFAKKMLQNYVQESYLTRIPAPHYYHWLCGVAREGSK